MILEHAILDIIPGQEAQFELAFEQAQNIIASMPGYLSHGIHNCIEHPNRYLLLVKWQRLEDHEKGFRGSPQYLEWKAQLHHFYKPFPEVWHFQNKTVLSSPINNTSQSNDV